MATFKLKRKLFMVRETIDYSSNLLQNKLNDTTNPRLQQKLKDQINYAKGVESKTALVKTTPNVPALATPTPPPPPPITPPPPPPVAPKPPVTPKMAGASKGLAESWKGLSKMGKAGVIAGGAALLGGGILGGKSLFGGNNNNQ